MLAKTKNSFGFDYIIKRMIEQIVIEQINCVDCFVPLLEVVLQKCNANQSCGALLWQNGYNNGQN